MNVASPVRSRWLPSPRRVIDARDVWLGIALITLLGAVVRFATLGLQSFWLDEAFTIHALRRPFGTMVDDVLNTQAQPPPYFILAWGWIRVFGSDEVGLRSMSALFGTATIPVAWGIGRAVIGRRAGLVLALFTALAPPLIWYSQEARAYALVILLSALSLLFFARMLREPRRRDLWLWAATSLIAVASHYFALFVVVPEAAWLVARVVDRRRDWPPFALLVAGLGALAPLVLYQREHGGADWIGMLDLSDRLRTAAAFAVSGQIVPSPFRDEWWFSGLVLALLAVAAVVALRRTAGPARTRTVALLVVGLGGLALPLAAAAVGSDFVLDRNLLPLWLPLVAVVAVALATVRPPVALAVAVALAGWFAYIDVRDVSEEGLQREDWREMSSMIGLPLEDRIIEMDPWWQLDPLRLHQPIMFDYGTPKRVRQVITFTYEGLVPYGEPRSTKAPGPPFREVRRLNKQHWRIVFYESPRPVRIEPVDLTGVGRARAVPYFQPSILPKKR
ncbi:MAG TPA: glycosyltransferase family 39 protein [Solirubrobacteraceae bacterium]